jgi:hypothetical protein
MKRRSVIALATAVGAAMMPAPAFAAGAVRQTIHEGSPYTCTDYVGVRVCAGFEADYRVINTPSGNQQYDGRATSTIIYTFTPPGFDTIDHYDFKIHALTKSGVPQETSWTEHVTNGNTGNTGRPNFICDVTWRYHLANGEMQYDRTDTVCSPS